jgi:ectoine hydroxylase-related dioxygenase (phytanoyl-CoA dioxygenase family)
MNFLEDLEEKGYCIIENILTDEEIQYSLNSFYEWFNSNPHIKYAHNKISPHGIFKHFEIGQQRHAWFIRTRPAVQNVFKEIWKTDELVVSFDGTCYIPKELNKKDSIWTHTDQAPNKKGLACYQGFVSLTENTRRTLVVYEGSHKLHESYCEEKKLTDSKNWLLIDHEYLDKIKDLKRVLHIKAGSLVIWDSRTFHQNQYGELPEERIVQYVSYLPKKHRSIKMEQKRLKYFNEKRTTSHWAYPVKVNSQQPRVYSNKDLLIDYSKLIPPKLDDLKEDIIKLI